MRDITNMQGYIAISREELNGIIATAEKSGYEKAKAEFEAKKEKTAAAPVKKSTSKAKVKDTDGKTVEFRSTVKEEKRGEDK